MDSLERLLFWLSALVYAGGVVVALVYLVRLRRYSQILMPLVALAGFVVQTIALFMRGFAIGHCPLGNLFEVVQYVVWSLVMLYLAIGPAFRLTLLGLFSAGLAALLSLVSLLMPGWDEPYVSNVFGSDPLIETHAAIAAFSFGAFALLAMTSVMYLIQNRALETKSDNAFPRFLPSIVQLETINLRLLLVGLSVLTVGVVTGIAIWQQDLARVTGWKLGVTIAVWMAYGVTAWLRLRQRLVARPFAWSLVGLFGAVLVALTVVDAERLPLP